MFGFHKMLASVAVAAATLAAAPLAAQDKSDWPTNFTIGTASQGGTYFVYGAGWANMITEALGVPNSAEATDGPIQNAAGIQLGDYDFGMVTMGPARDAWTGNSPLAPGVKHDKLRALFPMYQTGFHFIALKSSGITTLSDVPDGARVGVGPQGGTPGTYIPQIFEALGKTITVQYGGAADLAGQLQDGQIDVFGFAAGVPFPAFAQVEAQVPVTFIGFTDEEMAKVVEALPVSPFRIPSTAYSSLEEDQNSVAMWNFAVASADLPESFVYEVTKTIMTNHDKMMGVHKAARETLPENFDKNTFLPWHPGAARWFEENGFAIPADLKG
jgi:hypothetical protein